MKQLTWIASLLLSSTVSAGDNWPQFRGPTGDGRSKARGVPRLWSETENVAWKVAIPGRGWSSPVIWGGQIWLTSATPDGKQLFVIVVDRDSGKILRNTKLFDVDSPREIHKTNSYASPTPVLEEGRAYVHFGSYGTACIDMGTGKVLWERRDLPCHHWRGPGSSPILHGEMLIIHYDGFDHQYIVAMNKHNGETIWKKNREVDYGTDNGDLKKAYCTPIVIRVGDREQLISPAAMATIAYEPRTGEEIWRISYKQHSATARPLYGKGILYINSGFGKAELFAVRPGGRGDVTDTHVDWVVNKGVGSKPSHLLLDDLIYMVHDRGTAQCVDSKNGEQVWEQRLGGNFSASPIYVDGRLYFSNEEGATFVMAPGDTPKLLATNQLDAGCMASPAVAGKAIYLRTTTHLYRLEE